MAPRSNTLLPTAVNVMDFAVSASHTVKIHYCTLCRWMLRAICMAQELLTTFDGDIAEVALRPGTDGVFEIWLDEELLWERRRDGGFPDIKELKRRVRDRICADRDLGHIDR